MSLPTFETLELEQHGPVLTVYFNRPERLNALNTQMHVELEALIPAIEEAHEIRVAILTGRGRGFCAGGDFADDGRPPPKPYERDTIMDFLPSRSHVYNLLRTFVESSKPMIAAVNGPAAGIGAIVALLCDVVYMAEGARIGDRHTKMGMTAGDGGTVIMTALAGLNNAKEVLMSGAMIDADEAYRIGLANKVLPPAELLPAAREYAEQLAALPELGVRTTKIACNKMLQLYMNFTGELGMEFFGRCFASAEMEAKTSEFREGVNRG